MFDRDEQEISQIIETGLEAILNGEATLADVLAEHPGEVEEIRGELEGALWLISRQQEVEARPGFVAASRKRVIERIQAEASSQGARRALFGFAWPQRLAYQWIVMVVVAMLLLTGTGGMLTVSQSSLPGEDLYSVKRAAEQVAYTVTLSEVDKVELSAQFTDRRLEEAKVLLGKGDYSTVESTLNDYEQGIDQTIMLLNQVSNKPSNEVEEVAVTVKQNLADNVQELSAIANKVPMDGEVKAHIERAVTVSQNGAKMASNVVQKIQESKQAPTAASTSTMPPAPPPPPLPTAPANTATSAPTPKPTATRIPPPPPTQTKEPRPAAATAVPTNTLAPTLVPTLAPTSTATPAPTDTPVPTATDIPTQPPATPTDVPPTDTPAATMMPPAQSTDSLDTPLLPVNTTPVPTQTPQPTQTGP